MIVALVVGNECAIRIVSNPWGSLHSDLVKQIKNRGRLSRPGASQNKAVQRFSAPWHAHSADPLGAPTPPWGNLPGTEQWVTRYLCSRHRLILSRTLPMESGNQEPQS